MDLPSSLQDLITAQLASLNLSTVDESTASYISQLVEEDSFEPEDRKSAVMGMLEVDESDADMNKAITELLDKAQEYRNEMAAREAIEEEKAAELKAKEAESKGKTKVLTPEEEKARKEALLKAYGYLEEDTPEEQAAKIKAGEDKPPSAVYVDPKLLTKKARKKAENGVDILMQPNLNSAIVKGAELHRRQEDAAKAAAKREKDKGDMKKQKDDAAKKAEEKKKKAAKVERRA